MFIVIVDIDFKKELESDFEKWFYESNQILSKFKGFLSRRLADSKKGKQSIIVEHQSKETFDKMYHSEEYAQLQVEALSLFKVRTIIPRVYNLV